MSKQEQFDEKVMLAAERIELDRRALALREAAEVERLNFSDKEDKRPAQERVLDTAGAFYAFLKDGPVRPRKPSGVNIRSRRAAMTP